MHLQRPCRRFRSCQHRPLLDTSPLVSPNRQRPTTKLCLPKVWLGLRFQLQATRRGADNDCVARLTTEPVSTKGVLRLSIYRTHRPCLKHLCSQVLAASWRQKHCAHRPHNKRLLVRFYQQFWFQSVPQDGRAEYARHPTMLPVRTHRVRVRQAPPLDLHQFLLPRSACQLL